MPKTIALSILPKEKRTETTIEISQTNIIDAKDFDTEDPIIGKIHYRKIKLLLVN